MRSARDVARDLAAYALPADILPLAPRTPFERFSPAALAALVAHARSYPESRGMMSRAARRIEGIPDRVEPTSWVTMEAHFDAANMPQNMADALVALGFELDGFARFNPGHFTDHFTLKFKSDAAGKRRISALFGHLRARCEDATRLAERFSEVESYLEVEIYAQRHRWRPTALGVARGRRGQFPLSRGELAVVHLPRTTQQAQDTRIGLDAAKRADIHVKIGGPGLGRADRADLIARLEDAGFYSVLTWAGNDVCTAQFLNAADAGRIFRQLADFFEADGGATEMTLEPCVALWRSRDVMTQSLAEVPPLVLYADSPVRPPRRVIAGTGSVRPNAPVVRG